MADKFTERTMLDLLHSRYSGVSQGARDYAVAEHVRAYVDGAALAVGDRVADFLAQHCHTAHIRADGRTARWVSGSYVGGEARVQLHGHEVKVSRSDWLQELADPSKAESWKRHCDRWWLVAPDGVVRPGELPDGWGLLVPSGAGLRAKVMAPRLDPVPMSAHTRASFLRRVQETSRRRALAIAS